MVLKFEHDLYLMMYAATTFVFTLFVISMRFLLAKGGDQTPQRPCGDQTIVYRQPPLRNSDTIMSSRKSHRVGTLAVQLSYNYMYQECKTITVLLSCRTRWHLKQKVGKESVQKTTRAIMIAWYLLLCNCDT